MLSSAIVLFFAASASAFEVSSKFTTVSKHVESFHNVCPVTGAVAKGYMWTECNSGKTKTMGCVSADGQKYTFGETFVDAIAKWKCETNGDSIILRPVACVLSGQLLEIGEIAKHEKFFYQCNSAPDESVGLEIIACSDKNGDMVPIGTSYTKGKFVYQCDEEGDKVFTRAVGCIIEGMFQKIGEQLQTHDYVFECQAKGPRSARIEVVACVGEGRAYSEGETFGKGMVLYQCQAVDDVLEHVAVGCVAKDHRIGVLQELRFGEQWLETYKQDMWYKMECEQNNGKVGPVIVGCLFIQKGQQIVLNVGTGTIYEDHAYMCIGEGKAVTMKKKSIAKDQSGVELLQVAGVVLSEL